VAVIPPPFFNKNKVKIMIEVYNRMYYTDLTQSVQKYHVELDDVKRNLRMDDDDNDDDILISRLIKSAYKECENYINFDIAYKLNTLKVYNFNSDVIVLNTPNISSISGITYLKNGEYVEVTDYQKLERRNKTLISFQTSFDNTYTIDTDELVITFYSGYELDLELPEDIRQAIIIKTCDLFDVEGNSYITNSYKDMETWKKKLNWYKIIKTY